VYVAGQAQTMSAWKTLRSSGTSFVFQARVSRSTISWIAASALMSPILAARP
jgi:hypothetical protein